MLSWSLNSKPNQINKHRIKYQKLLIMLYKCFNKIITN